MQLVQAKPARFDLDSVRQLVGEDWNAVNREIQAQLSSDVALVNSVAHYIIGSGGKRLRPLLVLLAARACGYSGQQHVLCAAIIEFIHTATLLHDDVVDKSDLRRGQETANSVFGNQASVLVGDFLYSRAFQMMVQVGQMRIMDVLANATNTIAEGEVMQLMNCRDPETTEARYLQVIYRKTGKLFEAGMQIGAILAGQTLAVEETLVEYGKQVGLAFQLVDDALDYQADASELGKNIGTDLAEGKPTLPLIYALQRGSAREQLAIRRAIEHGGIEDLAMILEAIQTTGALAYTFTRAREASRQAVAALARVPGSPFKDALVQLADFAVERRY
ncbi:octaprenyl-diphosphate synthase [Gammaproteobacteria bacterium]|nr:octaprenyl diphosphate synthase [Gammaproteobacteria bacterium]QOJ31885.1 MAG: octaprenyl diphosphate synthase [Gammaproteobacteria bacterium]CAG0945675.1 octaprenyl-diphosphate synthase [Gammaproteobacteria bacterium]